MVLGPLEPKLWPGPAGTALGPVLGPLAVAPAPGAVAPATPGIGVILNPPKLVNEPLLYEDNDTDDAGDVTPFFCFIWKYSFKFVSEGNFLVPTLAMLGKCWRWAGWSGEVLREDGSVKTMEFWLSSLIRWGDL